MPSFSRMAIPGMATPLKPVLLHHGVAGRILDGEPVAGLDLVGETELAEYVAGET